MIKTHNSLSINELYNYKLSKLISRVYSLLAGCGGRTLLLLLTLLSIITILTILTQLNISNTMSYNKLSKVELAELSRCRSILGDGTFGMLSLSLTKSPEVITKLLPSFNGQRTQFRENWRPYTRSQSGCSVLKYEPANLDLESLLINFSFNSLKTDLHSNDRQYRNGVRNGRNRRRDSASGLPAYYLRSKRPTKCRSDLGWSAGDSII